MNKKRVTGKKGREEKKERKRRERKRGWISIDFREIRSVKKRINIIKLARTQFGKLFQFFLIILS